MALEEKILKLKRLILSNNNIKKYYNLLSEKLKDKLSVEIEARQENSELVQEEMNEYEQIISFMSRIAQRPSEE